MEALKKFNLTKRLFDLAFPEDLQWNDWFFNNVLQEEDICLLMADNEPVSSLILQQYKFDYHGVPLQLGYIFGANTHYRARGNGYMSQLLEEAIRKSYDRGDSFLSLIPANRRLFFFYDKFQFATVVYDDIERYTSLHNFIQNEEFSLTDPTFEAFNLLRTNCDSKVIFSLEEFENILHDFKHDNGAVVFVKDNEGNPAGMAFATANETEIHVKEITAVNESAKETVLYNVKALFNRELPILVRRQPAGDKFYELRAKGMMRIVNVLTVLSSLAASYPEVSAVIKVSDPLISENNGIFVLKDGKCFRTTETDVKVTLEVSVDVLTKILFSDLKIGEIFALPCSRPNLSLLTE